MTREESDFVFIEGTPIVVGQHGQTDFVFADEKKVENAGGSKFVFEEGTGLGFAEFSVTIDSTNEPIEEGETLDVKATVTNANFRKLTQFIELSIDDGVGVVDSQEITLSKSESKTITLSWDTSDGDGGAYTATVDSVDDSDSAKISVFGGETIDGEPYSTVEWTYDALSGDILVDYSPPRGQVMAHDGDSMHILNPQTGSVETTFSVPARSTDNARLEWADRFAMYQDNTDQVIQFYDVDNEQEIGTYSTSLDIGKQNPSSNNTNLFYVGLGPNSYDAHHVLDASALLNNNDPFVAEVRHSNGENTAGAVYMSEGHVYLGKQDQCFIYNEDFSTKVANANNENTRYVGFAGDGFAAAADFDGPQVRKINETGGSEWLEGFVNVDLYQSIEHANTHIVGYAFGDNGDELVFFGESAGDRDGRFTFSPTIRESIAGTPAHIVYTESGVVKMRFVD